MPLALILRKLSLKSRLIVSYLVILGIGGLATSLVGSWIVSSTIMTQARRSVDRDLVTARTLYEEQLQQLKRVVDVMATGNTIRRYAADSDEGALVAYLERVRTETGFDFLALADSQGRAVVRCSGSSGPGPAGELPAPPRRGDDVSGIAVVRAALNGTAAAATEILPAARLAIEDPALAARAALRVVPTPHSRAEGKTEETAGMVLLAAAPVRAPGGGVAGAVYGGRLLNQNFALVDRIWDVLFQTEGFGSHDVGTVTIFQGNLRIATNVKAGSGERAIGTQVSDEVRQTVLEGGGTWHDRAFVVKDWYVSAYEPIRNLEGKVIGILYVGVLDKAYTSTRNRVILSFFGIATVGFILIIGITYYMISNITHPIGLMLAATRNIAAGHFDQQVPAGSEDEIGLLAASFNTMAKNLRQMKADLEEWGRTLEEKVEQRTEELVTMQAMMARAERLASLGQLSAGVAHEINNPLGAILSLTALTLEDMPPDDPNREDLEEVVRQSIRCRNIVKGLLEFSRQSPFNKELLDLNRVLLETLALIDKQALFMNVIVVKHLDPELPQVLADASQCQQLFMNILINAVQAMDEKGTVTIVTRRSADRHSVEVAISDTGRGIPPERIDRIFDPFYSTKPSGMGTGLGLSIAYGIVTEHQGAISVASEVGKGSTFTVRLPAAIVSTESQAAGS
jgi:two-component system NtrC family sensor kinase